MDKREFFDKVSEMRKAQKEYFSTRSSASLNRSKVPERTEWHNIVCWGKTAEVVERFVHKGSSVYIQGKIRNRSYDGNDGQKRYVTEIECEVMQMLDKRPDNNQGQNHAASPFPPPQSNNQASSESDDLPF